jgi:DNA primase
VKLATENQEHTSHKKTRTNILNKAPQNTNQEQIFEKRRMRSNIDLIDKWRRREEESSMQ